jgi:hypothetical protein
MKPTTYIDYADGYYEAWALLDGTRKLLYWTIDAHNMLVWACSQHEKIYWNTERRGK